MKSALSPIFGLSQWSTFQSGPLATSEAHENRPKLCLLAEPVVYFPEWSTGSRLAPRFALFSLLPDPASGPLFKVDH